MNRGLVRWIENRCLPTRERLLATGSATMRQFLIASPPGMVLDQPLRVAMLT